MKASDKFRKSYRAPTQEVGRSVGMALHEGEYRVTIHLSHATLGCFTSSMGADEADEIAKDLKFYAMRVREQQSKTR